MALGSYYADQYRAEWGNGFKVGLWADVDRRTIATTDALVQGFVTSGVRDVAVGSASATKKADPLFHPFEAGCGKPDVGILSAIKASLDNNWSRWVETHKPYFDQLYMVLGCKDSADCNFKPTDKDKAEACSVWTKDCKAPIKWTGQFSYASSASEAFLLEYATT